MSSLINMAFVVAVQYKGETYEVDRPDGNPFPYSRLADARRFASSQQRIARSIKEPITMRFYQGDESETVEVNPLGLRYFVCDWITLREVR